MTLQEALEKSLPRIRRPLWANPSAYIRLPLLPGGLHGVWVELYDEWGQKALEIPVGSQKVLIYAFQEINDFEAYTGPAHSAEPEGRFTES